MSTNQVKTRTEYPPHYCQECGSTANIQSVTLKEDEDVEWVCQLCQAHGKQIVIGFKIVRRVADFGSFDKSLTTF